jgi:ankyrin repeat protein
LEQNVVSADDLISYLATYGTFPFPELVEWVKSHGIESEFKAQHAYDANRRTLLHYAAEYGDMKAICWLVAQGADVNRKDSHGWTPLHYAVDLDVVEATQDGKLPDDLPTVRLLIELGAEPYPTDEQGRTPADLMQNDDCAATVYVSVARARL